MIDVDSHEQIEESADTLKALGDLMMTCGLEDGGSEILSSSIRDLGKVVFDNASRIKDTVRAGAGA